MKKIYSKVQSVVRSHEEDGAITVEEAKTLLGRVEEGEVGAAKGLDFSNCLLRDKQYNQFPVTATAASRLRCITFPPLSYFS